MIMLLNENAKYLDHDEAINRAGKFLILLLAQYNIEKPRVELPPDNSVHLTWDCSTNEEKIMVEIPERRSEKMSYLLTKYIVIKNKEGKDCVKRIYEGYDFQDDELLPEVFKLFIKKGDHYAI